MKNITALAFILAIGFTLVSCGNDCDVLIDPAPTPVSFTVNDAEGNNLLDKEFEGNILGNGIEITYGEESYPLVLSEFQLPEKMGLHTGKIGTDKVPGIMFWFFYIGRDSGQHEFIINWGDGTSDKVKFDYYYTVVNCRPVTHKKIYLNGQLKSNDSLSIEIVK